MEVEQNGKFDIHSFYVALRGVLSCHFPLEGYLGCEDPLESVFLFGQWHGVFPYDLIVFVSRAVSLQS